MKTKEFIAKVEALGFQTHVSGKKIKVCDEMRGYGVGDPMFIITPDFPEVYIPSEFYMLSIERFTALKLIIEYLETPITEREEEKLYNVKFPAITRLGRNIYLSKEKGCVDPISVDWSGETFIHDRPSLYTFTEQEIKDIDERYLAFKVEVKDE
jgi:hypothetical protein